MRKARRSALFLGTPFKEAIGIVNLAVHKHCSGGAKAEILDEWSATWN